MARPRRSPRPGHFLDAASRSLAQATRQLLEAAAGGVTHDHLRQVGWYLVQLTGGLAELTATAAVRLDEHARIRLLRTQEGGDPTENLTRAARLLTELRQALDRADEAARDYYACLSRLVVDADPSLTGKEPRRG